MMLVTTVILSALLMSLEVQSVPITQLITIESSVPSPADIARDIQVRYAIHTRV